MKSHIHSVAIPPTPTTNSGSIAMRESNKLLNLVLQSKPSCKFFSADDDDVSNNNESPRTSSNSPFVKSPWNNSTVDVDDHEAPATGLLRSLTREVGPVYSLAVALPGGLLYTGTDSKNIRVWNKATLHDVSAFKSASGLVKAIVVSSSSSSSTTIFTGHQDGKIRVWRASARDPHVHKRVGTLPKLTDYLKSSINPSNYVEVRRHKNAVWLRHFDAVSCLSLNEEAGLLYSGSWDRTIKVWSVAGSRCLESISAHDDAINSVAVGFDGLLFSGSADGTVKAWRKRESDGRHVLVRTLLRQESAVTSVAVSRSWRRPVVYCGSSDGTVRWWWRGEEEGGGGGGALRGHKRAVLCLATAGRMVMSGGADGRVCVWRRTAAAAGSGAHERVAVLVGHVGPVKCLAVEREEEGGARRGWRVYSGGLDKSVKVWKVAGEEEE